MIKNSLIVFLFFTFLTGIVYPLFMTGIGQLFMNEEVNGSLIQKNNQWIGSSLIAQKFEKPEYFWPRPSAVDYNPMASGGSNLGRTSQILLENVNQRKKAGLKGDLLFTSASGLDPHLQLESALQQVERIAIKRNLEVSKIKEIIFKNVEDRQYKIFGEIRVNVLKLNLLLDELK